ncbi:MAG: putative tartrate dehydrogenase/decarboxylase TtuC' [Alphaproteobacteria bacterium MarineAlpha9_Bin3]|nr:MAG: putative tartrate dehydrogenase/decarboxylase TtuC' [Alphaproteobacteria bacterium MarineAlpha9_Bin3]|tara:strand:+ start:7373 stop:8443 length:1071 start_codon:yes stop_codon:yes gene_type:complete
MKQLNKHNIAIIPGDGIGPEVINSGLKVIRRSLRLDNISIKEKVYNWGSNYYKKHQLMMPKNGLEKLKQHNAIFFGAVGDEKIADDITLWGLRLKICQGLDQFANIRPSKYIEGIKSPLDKKIAKNIDWLIVRENSEGEYAGSGGIVHRDLPIEIGSEVAIFTKEGCRRIHDYAFKLALKRPRKHLTLITKSNAQRHGMKLWDKMFYEVKRKYPTIKTEKLLVDAATAVMVNNPEKIDVMVATNLHADILSDLASALSGSLGIGATANISTDKKIPSMFEPIHGSAFDIVGKNIANPIGAIWSGMMMLEHLGEKKSAARIFKAIKIYANKNGPFTPDLGGIASTDQVTNEILKLLD